MASPTTDNPTGAPLGSGGDWLDFASYARCAYRNYYLPDVAAAGFNFRFKTELLDLQQ